MNLAPDITIFRGIASAPFRSTTRISNKSFVLLGRDGRRTIFSARPMAPALVLDIRSLTARCPEVYKPTPPSSVDWASTTSRLFRIFAGAALALYHEFRMMDEKCHLVGSHYQVLNSPRRNVQGDG